MVVKRVEIIDKLLIVLHRDVRLSLLDVSDLGLIARQLLLHLFDNAFVVLDLLLNVLVGDSFSGVGLSLCLLGCTSGLVLLSLTQPLLDKTEH